MRPLPINELPRHSAWATYLLDSSDDPPSDFGEYTSTATYEDIYAFLLKHYRETKPNFEAFVEETRSRGRKDLDVISVDERLYLASTADLIEREATAVRTALRPVLNGGETVVDLGCGWGATLGVIANEFPSAAVIGGEYSPSGVELARELHAETDRIAIEQFDFYGEWDLFDGDETVIFTRGALATLPDIEPVLDRFAKLAATDTVAGGVHLEQTGPYPETVLGLLRRRYAEVHGYNTDFLPAIERRQDFEVTHVEDDVVGVNPLHPWTVVRWQSDP